VLGALGPYREMLEPQRQHLLSLYRPVDVAFKVVGTGSVGLRDYCIYFEGNGPRDPLFLQIKRRRPRSTPHTCQMRVRNTTMGGALRMGSAAMQLAIGSISGLDADGGARLPGAAAE